MDPSVPAPDRLQGRGDVPRAGRRHRADPLAGQLRRRHARERGHPRARRRARDPAARPQLHPAPRAPATRAPRRARTEPGRHAARRALPVGPEPADLERACDRAAPGQLERAAHQEEPGTRLDPRRPDGDRRRRAARRVAAPEPQDREPVPAQRAPAARRAERAEEAEGACAEPLGGRLGPGRLVRQRRGRDRQRLVVRGARAAPPGNPRAVRDPARGRNRLARLVVDRLGLDPPRLRLPVPGLLDEGLGAGPDLAARRRCAGRAGGLQPARHAGLPLARLRHGSRRWASCASARPPAWRARADSAARAPSAGAPSGTGSGARRTRPCAPPARRPARDSPRGGR